MARDTFNHIAASIKQVRKRFPGKRECLTNTTRAWDEHSVQAKEGEMLRINGSSDQTRQKSFAIIRINKRKVMSRSPALYATRSHLVLSES